MSFAPLLSAPPVVQLHAAAALGAFGLGAYQMASRKGMRGHRRAGRLWVVLMGVVALSSLGIVSSRPWIGPFGPIHALSALTLMTLPVAVTHARRGRIAGHRRAMMLLFFIGLVLTGAFTLIPGRLMHQAVFGSSIGLGT